MIYFIAPYSKQFLGASRKMELLLSILYEIDKDLVLINSFAEKNELQTDFINLNIKGINVQIKQCFLPDQGFNRLSSSVLNYFNKKKIIQNIVAKFGVPDTLWLYNGYVLESFIAADIKKKYKSFLFFEFEDWHFSRSRGFNPKPYLDFWAWKKLMPIIDYGFAVNSFLGNKIKEFNKPYSILPGLISTDLLVETRKNEPFIKEKIKVGYFGGLSEEKGAKLILNLYAILPSNFEFIITGTGELESEYLSLAKNSDGRFQYFGRVSDKQLYSLIASTDVILNPHKPITEMTNGVFPFKVTEAIASGRLVISTPLMDKDFNQILEAVSFIDYDLKQWKSVLINSKQLYKEKQDNIKKCAEDVIKLFSEDSVRALIRIQIAS